MGSLRQFREGHATGVANLPWRRFIEDYIVRQEMPAELFEGVMRLVEMVARRLPPSMYSPIHRWDDRGDAHRTIATDVLADQVEKGHLEKLYYASRSDLQICRHFRRAIKWHLHGIADGRGARCLAIYQKIRSVLQHGQCFHYLGPVLGWGLSE